MVLVVVKWRAYLLTFRVRIRADDQHLLELFKKIDATGRVARWLVTFSDYTIN